MSPEFEPREMEPTNFAPPSPVAEQVEQVPEPESGEIFAADVTRQEQLKEAKGEEAFAEWEAKCDVLINQKLAAKLEGAEHSEAYEAQAAAVKSCLKEILATEVMSVELFDALLDNITIAKENKQAANGNNLIVEAYPNRGGLIIYPRFFDADLPFNREHGLAHDLGELAYVHFNHDEYNQHKADRSLAMEGDYADETRAKLGDEAADREAFCEMFADVIRSKTGIETGMRRFDRYADSSVLQKLTESEEGLDQLEYLMQESHALRAVILRQNAELLPKLQERAAARQTESAEGSDGGGGDDDDPVVRDEPSTLKMAQPQTAKKPRGKLFQFLLDFFGAK